VSPVPADYVDVAERIRQFKMRYPDGVLQSGRDPQLFQVGDKTYIAYCALAVTHPDEDKALIGVGWAWEPVPGPTPFTRDSELMNAETSAWGRAIVALGFETKKIASSEEVRNRQASPPPTTNPAGSGQYEEDRAWAGAPPPATEKPAASGQYAQIKTTLKLLDETFPEHPGDGRTWADVAREHAGKSADRLSMAEANALNDWLEDQYRAAQQEMEVPFG
jgi:hypothetical protein